MNEPTPTKKETAYHEAGHAVVSNYFGFGTKIITIRPTDDYDGRHISRFIISPKSDGLRSYRRDIRRWIIILYAGLEAERLINPEANPEYLSDYQEAFDLLREYPVGGNPVVGDDIYMAYLEKLQKEARRLVKRLRPLIDLVAEELLKREEITGEELEKLLSAQESE